MSKRILFALIFATGILRAAPAPVSGAHACVGGTGTVTTAAITTTAGTLLIVTPSDYNQDSTTDVVSDSKGNAWHHIALANDGMNINGTIWYAWDHGGSALSVGSGHTATITTSSSSGFCFAAYSGTQVSSDPLDQSAVVGFCCSGGSQISASITPTANNEIIITSVSTDSVTPYTVDNGYTVVDSQPFNGAVSFGNGQAYLVQTALNITSVTWSGAGSVGWAIGIASFKEGAGGGPPAKRRAAVIQ